MATSKGVIQGYTGVAAVDEKSQIIVDAHHIDAYIPDNGYRKRDERYTDQAIHKTKPDPLWNKTKEQKAPQCFSSAEFTLADDHSHCICPAGKRLYRNGVNCTIGGYKAMHSPAHNKIAYPATAATNAYANRTKPKHAKSPSSKANAAAPAKRTR